MAFLKRVFEVLQKDSYPTVCSFSENGESIIVHSIAEAEKSFLADVFNHSNYNSFVRQLNVYGFRKKRNSSMIEFSHPNFKRDRPDLIAYMARKGGKRKVLKNRQNPLPTPILSFILMRLDTCRLPLYSHTVTV